ncbi:MULTISPECIES: helix-turn-helix domain-containing protein [unclassified Aeromicrobium]|jgi:excisionase family DNA binding protein|uniref:helix-turn-helix domain-containing protein n=1 Tax=unclassified Aeromicrobium TaxID=2633570 RepID=UPI000ACC6F6B|nr:MULTISPECIES: helix-turn-helix domain-containing protein [unclassified Aeromicrobium]
MTDLPVRLTVEEAAAITRESAFTIRKRCRDGVLPAAKHGRSWWILRADLDRYMQATNTPSSEPERAPFMTTELRRQTRQSASQASVFRTADQKRRRNGGGKH